MKCNKCQSEISEGAKFCKNCGSLVQASPNPPAAEEKNLCKKCGSQLAEGAQFCNNCGASVEREASEPKQRVCKNCGSPLRDGAAFCAECGTAVSDSVHTAPAPVRRESTKPSQAPANKPAKKKSPLMIFLIVLLVCVVAACAAVTGLICYNRFQDDMGDDESMSYDVDDDEDEDKEDKKIDKKDKKDKDDLSEIDYSTIESIVNDNSLYTKYGVYVHNLTNGYTFGYNEDEPFLASAMCQVVILNTLAELADDYDIDLDSEYMYFSYMPNGKEAPDSKSEDGLDLPLRKYVEDVAVYGDNNKSNALVDYIADLEYSDNGFDVINAALADDDYINTEINRKIFINQDLVDTSVSPNITTPADIAGIFEDLMDNDCIGSKTYMMNIFKCISNSGEPVGLKKFIPAEYSSCNVNAFTAQSTNDVAFISDGKTKIIAAILSETQDSHTKTEDNNSRQAVQQKLLEYILETQFQRTE